MYSLSQLTAAQGCIEANRDIHRKRVFIRLRAAPVCFVSEASLANISMSSLICGALFDEDNWTALRDAMAFISASIAWNCRLLRRELMRRYADAESRLSARG